jgi:hypothetical protein
MDKKTTHYRKDHLCRVSNNLMSIFWALDKEAICRVTNKKHSVKKALDEEALCPMFFTLDKELLCRVFFSTLGKDNFKIIF